MPPPHYTPASRDGGSSSASAALPKTVDKLSKEAIQKIRAALTSTGSSIPLAPALDALAALLADPALVGLRDHVPQRAEEEQDGGAGQGRDASSSGSLPPAPVWQAALRKRMHENLTDIFVDEMDQDDVPRLAALVEILSRLGPLIAPSVIVTDWWDLLLRPVLKNTAVAAITASKARNLVLKAMVCGAASAYPDEPPPVAVWPAVDEPGTAARKSGDAPYTLAAATTPLSPAGRSQRSASTASSTSRSSVYTGKAAASREDMYKRFAARVFDLYVSDAAHSLDASREEEDDQQDAEEEEQQRAAPSAANTASTPTAPLSPNSSQRKRQNVQAVWRKNMEAIVLAFGAVEPKRFFFHVAEGFREASGRIALLVLLANFMRQHSIHIYHITSTALPKQLLLSLQLDTSETVISLGTTVLVMMMPHIPNWIANGGAGGLPTFLNVLSRIIDWRKLGSGWENRGGEENESARREKDEEHTEVDRLVKRLNIRPELEWQRVDTSVDRGLVMPPDAMQLFTFLYGLFPCNTIRFLRAPIDYLRKASYESPFEGDWEEMVDERAIQTRSAKVLREHALHPALVALNAEKEVQDKQRWMRYEAADITAECIGLYLGAWHDRATVVSPTADEGALFAASIIGERHLDHSLSLAGSLAEAEDRNGIPLLELDKLSGAATPIAMHRRGSSTNVSSGSGSPALRATVTARTALNAEDILATHATLKRGDSIGGPGLMNRSTTWTPDTSVEGGPSPRSLSMSRTAVGSAPMRFRFPAASSALAAIAGGVPDAGSSTPNSPAALDSAARGDRMRTGSFTNADGTARGRTSRQASPTRSSQSMHRHALVSSLSNSTRTTDSSSGRPARAEVYSELLALQRENLLLRNELNFELYLKEQHLRHIGRLHRERINDTALEAERQNLYYTVRSLRSQLANVTSAAEKQRAEAATIKARHLTWENEQNSRLKTFREERKAWVAEMQSLRAQLEEANATIKAQDDQMQEALNARSELEARLTIAAPKLEKIEEYQQKVRQLSSALAHWQDDVQKYEEQRREMQVLLGRWREMELILKSMDQQVAESEERKLEAEDRAEQLAAQLARAQAQARRPVSAPPQPLQSGDRRETAQLHEYAQRTEALEAELVDLRAKLGEAQAAVAYARFREEQDSKAFVTDWDSDVPALHLVQ